MAQITFSIANEDTKVIYTAKTKVMHKDKMTMGEKSNVPKFWVSLASCYLRWCQQLQALNKPIAQLIYIFVKCAVRHIFVPLFNTNFYMIVGVVRTEDPSGWARIANVSKHNGPWVGHLK